MVPGARDRLRAARSRLHDPPTRNTRAAFPLGFTDHARAAAGRLARQEALVCRAFGRD
jgi:hypothetical protein